MAKTKITAPVAQPGEVTGVGGLVFTDGVAETDNEAIIAYAEANGYGVGSKKPRSAEDRAADEVDETSIVSVDSREAHVEPTIVGRPTEALTSRTSSGEAGVPVEMPVTMMPSARKNSAAFAVSAMPTSAVIACAECFFFTSAKTRTASAPIARRYRSKSPASDSVRPSSATCAKTKPSTRTNEAPHAWATAMEHRLAAAST